MRPKEDPTDKAARVRERRITSIEQQKTTEQSAAALTSDLRAVYGMKGLTGLGGTVAQPTKTANPTAQMINAIYNPRAASIFGGKK